MDSKEFGKWTHLPITASLLLWPHSDRGSDDGADLLMGGGGSLWLYFSTSVPLFGQSPVLGPHFPALACQNSCENPMGTNAFVCANPENVFISACGVLGLG